MFFAKHNCAQNVSDRKHIWYISYNGLCDTFEHNFCTSDDDVWAYLDDQFSVVLRLRTSEMMLLKCGLKSTIRVDFNTSFEHFSLPRINQIILCIGNSWIQARNESMRYPKCRHLGQYLTWNKAQLTSPDVGSDEVPWALMDDPQKVSRMGRRIICIELLWRCARARWPNLT